MSEVPPQYKIMKLQTKVIDVAKNGGYEVGVKTDAEMLLDPKFFQALGKTEGWSLDVCHHVGLCGGRCEYDKIPRWLREWHRFVDYLANSGTPDDFFTNLLTTPKGQ